jgi:hypothetical protein
MQRRWNTAPVRQRLSRLLVYAALFLTCVLCVLAICQTSVPAQVDGNRFVSTAESAHSPNEFRLSARTPLYREVFCRVIDGAKVIAFVLPRVTQKVRYEVAQSLALLDYTKNVFAPDPMALSATGGMFFDESDRDEIDGVFSAAGAGFDLKNGRFC